MNQIENEMIRQEYASGKKAKTLAYEFGMNETTIRDICKGVRKWKA